MGDGSGRDGSSNRSRSGGMGDLPAAPEALPRPLLPAGPALTSPGKLRAEPPRCGQHQRPAGRSMWPGSAAGRAGEEVSARRGRGGAARRRQGADRAAGVGEGRKAGEGGGRERGGNNVAGSAPAEFRFRTPPQGRFRSAGSSARRWIRGRGAPRAPRRGGSGGHRLAGAEELPAGDRPRRRRGRADAPLGPRPSRTPRHGAGGAGAGGRRRARRRRPNAAGPGLGREEARRPGRRKRGPDPPPAAARLREGARRTCGGAWAGGAGAGGRRPLPGAGGAAGGVSPTPGRPLPAGCGLAEDPR